MAQKIIEHDGQYYAEGEQVWDLGSFECIDGQDVNQRNYQGFSTDVNKLPKYDNLEAGSTAYCLDTGDYYIYHAKTKTWVLQD